MTPSRSSGDPSDPEAIAQHFLTMLGKDPARTFFRTFGKRGTSPGRHRFGRDLHGCDAAALTRDNLAGESVYFVTGDARTASGISRKTGRPTGAVTDDDCFCCRAFFVEWDNRPIEWQVDAWRELGLPEPSVMVHTGGQSIHVYWVLSAPIPTDEWAPIQHDLLAYCQADTTICNPSRVMRLPGFLYVDKASGQPTANRAEVIHTSALTYTAEQIAAAITPSAPPRQPIYLDDGQPPALQPRGISEIRDALARIPIRTQGSYEFHRNVLWGLVAACQDAGGTIDTAIALMEAHSPSRTCGWDIDQVARSGDGSYGAGTFWRAASQHGYDISRTTHTTPRHRSSDDDDDTPAERTTRPPDEEISCIFEQLLDLKTSTGDTWAKEHALRAELWRLGVPAAAIDERIFYALAQRWDLPLQTSHNGGRRGMSLTDPIDSQAIDLVPGFLLWQRDHVIFGAGGAGKTKAAAALAVSCIKGKPFLDQEIPPSRTGRVLWIGTDGGDGARAMVHEYLEDLGAADDPEIIAGMNIWTAEASTGHSPWATTPSGLQELKDELDTGGYALVVIDSLKAVLELAGINFGIGPVGTLMRLMQCLVCRHCSLVWLHHPAGGKAAGKGLTAAAGNQNINQIPSGVHQITRKTDDRGPCNVWSVHKLRGATSREFSYREADEGFEVVDGQITKNAREALLDSIDLRQQQGIPTTTIYLRQEMPQHNESTIRNNLTWLRKRGFIRRCGRNWVLAKQGQTFLRFSHQGIPIDSWLKGSTP